MANQHTSRLQIVVREATYNFLEVRTEHKVVDLDCLDFRHCSAESRSARVGKGGAGDHSKKAAVVERSSDVPVSSFI